MTPYEIDRMIESRRPTRWDAEPVMEASESDLDPNLNIESTRGKTLGEVGIPTSIALRFKT